MCVRACMCRCVQVCACTCGLCAPCGRNKRYGIQYRCCSSSTALVRSFFAAVNWHDSELNSVDLMTVDQVRDACHYFRWRLLQGDVVLVAIEDAAAHFEEYLARCCSVVVVAVVQQPLLQS